MSRLLRLLDRLEQAKIAYRLEHVRDSIMIVAAVPGERWEIEFLEDGEIEIERFTSSGVTDDQDLLAWLLATHRAEGEESVMAPVDGAAPDDEKRSAPSSLQDAGRPRQ